MNVDIAKLLNKNVVSDKGTIIGKLKDMEIESSSGRIIMLVVKPGPEINPNDFETDAQGNVHIPFSAIRAIRDVIIVSEAIMPRT